MQATDRLHALDAVRAFALLLGVVLHACMSFFLPFPVLDVSESTTLAVVFYTIHIFRMAAFYFIAGFFAHMSFHRKGARAFLADRGKRIGIPLVAGWVILGPLTIAAFLWGAYVMWGPAVLEQQQDISATDFPLVHLWFLYYLLLFIVGTLVIRQVFAAIDRDGRLRRCVDRLIAGLTRSFVLPVVLALPLGIWLFYKQDWEAWGGVTTPDTGFVPQLTAVIGFGTAFGFGWLMHRQVDLLARWRRYWALYLAIAIGLTANAITVVGAVPNFLDPSPAVLEGNERLFYVAAYTLAIWCWIMALVGGAMRFLSGYSAVRRYVADASYWIYLWHLPIIAALQVWMARWDVHWAVKFPLIMSITLGITLVSYHCLVRYSFIGAILNGRRHVRPARNADAIAAE